MSVDNYTLETVISQVNVMELAKTDVLSVSSNWSIRKLSQFFIKHGISGAPVIDGDNKLVGVITQSDVVRFETQPASKEGSQEIIRHFMGPNINVDERTFKQVQDHAEEYFTVEMLMTPKVFSVNSKSSLLDAYKLIKKQDIHRLFVTFDNQICGVLTAQDILDMIMTQMADVIVPA